MREYDRTPPLWRDPGIPANYRILVETGGEWREAEAVTDNVLPCKVHRFEATEVTAVRVEFDQQPGGVGVHEVRVY